MSSDLENPPFSEMNIIITDSSLYTAARTLALYHEDQGFSTTVVNTSWIYAHYEAADPPDFNGYKDTILSRIFIREYREILAQKIISFLQDTASHPQLEYVTLFGNGRLVPASYYIYSRFRNFKYLLGRIPLPDIYNNRIATDFFYISPNYDLWPDYNVGRLPVATIEEADHVVDKIITWQDAVDWDWFNNVYVAGDQPNHPEEMDLDGCYAGEMIAVDAINNNYFQGMQVDKLFWTENRFNMANISQALEQGESGFFYIMAHGMVDRWVTYPEANGYIYAEDIRNYEEKSTVPIVVSVACMSGAFDTYCAHPFLVGRGTRSLGESILLSDGAGIAYVGTTRATLGSPIPHLMNGELSISKERGIAGLLTYFFKAYHEGGVFLGDIVTTSITSYVNDNVFPSSPEKDEAFIALISYTLLGDPLLQLPEQDHEYLPSYEQPQITALDPNGYTSETYPRPWYAINEPMELTISTDADVVTVKLIDIDADEVVDRQLLSVTDGEASYSYTSTTPSRYLFRASVDDGKEGWLYVSTQYP